MVYTADGTCSANCMDLGPITFRDLVCQLHGLLVTGVFLKKTMEAAS
jgi:hypothetical protein